MRRRAAPFVLLAAVVAAPAMAADSSAWDGDARAAVRLIAGSATGEAALRAGVQIRLAPGWKTYWRYPGDSGVPPRFDFTQSTNVGSVTVAWPAPHRFTDADGSSIGYKEGVIFPLRVVPQDPARPVTLRLALDYAVCEKLCVPAAGRAELALSPAPSPHDAALAAAQAQVPRRASLGAGTDLAIRSVVREPGPDKPRIAVEVAAPAGASVDLFAEGPTPDWALPLPEPGAPAGDVRRFTFALDGAPPDVRTDGVTLTLTAVAGTRAIEVPIRLD